MASSHAPPPAAMPSARDETILAHTNLLAINFAPAASAASPAAAAAAAASAVGPSVDAAAAAASPSVLALQKQIAAYLPTREWYRIPLQFDPATAFISHFSIQHGASLPQLAVRVLPNHVICDDARGRELDAHLQWLMESIGAGSSYPVLGVDCESDCRVTSDGEVRLLQLSTGTRCLLIRVPEQAALREVVGHASLEKQVANASGSANGQANATPAPSPLFTPYFHSLLSNRSIFKSGAELWTDALDLWACTGTGASPAAIGSGGNAVAGAEMNSCLNMSWIYRNEHGGALSLAAMVNLSLGSERCFLKDKATTTSDWGAQQLTLRQLIYAALDAQASFVAGANQSQIPKPFHVSDMPRTWLAVAASWKQVLRSAKMTRESRPNRYDPSADALFDATQRLLAQTMQGEEPFNPFVSALLQISFPQASTAQQSMPPPNAHLIAQSGATPLSPTYFQGEDLAIETSNVGWWFATTIEPSNTSAQSELAELLDRTRVSAVCGAAGSGKTVAAALEAIRSLQRTSSIALDHSPMVMRTAAQRVLILTETEHAARAAVDALSKVVEPHQCMLLLSSTFLQQWSEADMPQVRRFVSTNDEDDRPILVCAIDYALSLSAGTADATVGQWRLHHRQTLIVDDASQVWLLKLVLLLRRLPHTERLVLFGDAHAYAARWGDLTVDDALTAAINSSRSTAARAPQPFRVQRHRLTGQMRMGPHITAAVSETFYNGKLPLLPGNRTRGLGWVDVRTEEHATAAVTTIWNHYLGRGLRADQLAVLVLTEAARLAFASFAPRVFTPEAFQGRQADVVFLILPVVGAASGVTEKRRLLVSCTRAASKLFLFGDRSLITSPSADATIQALCEFESRDLEEVFPDLVAGDAAAASSTFLALNGVAKSPEVPAPAPSASWAGLAKDKAPVPAASPEKKPVAEIVAQSVAAQQQQTPAEPRNKKAAAAEKKAAASAAAAAAAAAAEAAVPTIEFQSAPENRAWKVLPCDKLHSVDGRRPSGTCHLGDKCGFLHNDFWIRRGGGAGEFVLFTPGSKIALVEVVEPWNDRRMRQMEQVVDSKLNRANRDRAAKEFAAFFPTEEIIEEPPAPQQTNNIKKNVVGKAQQVQPQPTPAQVPAPVAPAPSTSPIESPVEEVGGRRQKRARKKVIAQQEPEAFAEPVGSVQHAAAASGDDFVPVSRRHGGAKPTREQLAAEATAQVEAEYAEQLRLEEEAAARLRIKQEAEARAEAEAEAQAAAAAEAAEAAAEAEAAEKSAAAAAAKAKKEKAEPEVAVEYPDDMVAGSWWLPAELASLSKNARKKLLWVCPACRAPNANGDARCSLCNGSKPAPGVIRYAKPPGSLGPLPREVDGKYAYESEWVKLVAPPSGGAPWFVAAKAIPAGTIILREDALYSEVAASAKQALIPQPRACAQLAQQLLNDPVQMALLRARWQSAPWNEAQLKAFIRNAEGASGVPSLKPKDLNQLKEWPMAMAWATTAKYAREDQEGHAMECKCHRFKLPRQSAVLVPSCWPNTAVVQLHMDPMLTADQMAILAVTDIPAGTQLTNVSDQALLNLPSDRRQQTISLAKYRLTGRACHCERCSGKIAVEQEKLLLQEIPGYTVDKARVTSEYDKVMIAYSETQHSKSKVYKLADGKDPASVPKDAVSDAAYFALCYAFLTRAFDFLTTHPLHPCHWRMQKVRELYLSLVRCDFLYRMDYMSLSGLTAPEGQHMTLRQIVHVLDSAIRSDQQYFLPMEPMKSLPLLTLLELCTFLIQNKVTIRPAPKPTTKETTSSSASAAAGAAATRPVWKVETLEFEGIGRFDSQAAFLLNLSQLNQYAAIIRTLNFPYRRVS